MSFQQKLYKEYVRDLKTRAPHYGFKPKDVHPDRSDDVDEDDTLAIMQRWLPQLSHDQRLLWLRTVDPTVNGHGFNEVNWLATTDFIDRATAHLLFWTIMGQYPYASSQEDLDDWEHGVPEMERSLKTLADGIAKDKYISSGVGLKDKEIAPYRDRLEQQMQEAKDRHGWTVQDARFKIPPRLFAPIEGRVPEKPQHFPAPKDRTDAEAMLYLTSLGPKTFWEASETVDGLPINEKLIVWGAYALTGAFIAYLLFK